MFFFFFLLLCAVEMSFCFVCSLLLNLFEVKKQILSMSVCVLLMPLFSSVTETAKLCSYLALQHFCLFSCNWQRTRSSLDRPPVHTWGHFGVASQPNMDYRRKPECPVDS